MRTVDESGTSDAEALLAELERPHRGGEGPDAVATHRGSIHSNPHTSSQISDESQNPASETPPPVDMGMPPVGNVEK